MRSVNIEKRNDKHNSTDYSFFYNLNSAVCFILISLIFYI
jgi:hypothetical protein